MKFGNRDAEISPRKLTKKTNLHYASQVTGLLSPTYASVNQITLGRIEPCWDRNLEEAELDCSLEPNRWGASFKIPAVSDAQCRSRL